MDIQSTRQCNLWNLESVANYLQIPPETLVLYYDELLADDRFLQEINLQLNDVQKNYGFFKGIFRRQSISSADWFAFERVLLYVLLRHLRPSIALETGVFYGGNTAFMLAALERNGIGKLISVDLPGRFVSEAADKDRHPHVGDSESYCEGLSPGFIVPWYLRSQWELIEGNSLDVIPKVPGPIDFFIHDSNHSFAFVQSELNSVLPKLSASALIVADDIDWSNGFFAFCLEKQIHPVLLTDNGKDNLRVRMGLVSLSHPNNLSPQITGRAA